MKLHAMATLKRPNRSQAQAGAMRPNILEHQFQVSGPRKTALEYQPAGVEDDEEIVCQRLRYAAAQGLDDEKIVRKIKTQRKEKAGK